LLFKLLKALDLLADARGFAGRLSSVLNSTVTNGVRLSVAETPRREVVVGNGVAKQDLDSKPFALNRGPDGQTLHMLVSYRLTADDEGRFLQVASSVVALFADAEETELLHFDYERDKAHDYPEAHVQVVASSPAWEGVTGGRALARLHLPVGGRRFRFTLEDIAAFLLREHLVMASKGALSTLAEHRAQFERDQLCAAIRRDPNTARQYLAQLDKEGDEGRG
jgi:hypothetical protein